jgi:hypothetical protein
MTPDSLTPETITAAVAQGFQIMFVVAAVLYLIFSLLVIRQIDLMKKTLITPFSPVITAIGLIHLAAAGALVWIYSVML